MVISSCLWLHASWDVAPLRAPSARLRSGRRLSPHLGGRSDCHHVSPVVCFATAFAGQSVRKPVRCGRRFQRALDESNLDPPKTSDALRTEVEEGSKVKSAPSTNKWLYLFQRLFADMAKASEGRRRDWTYWGILVGSAVLAVIGDLFGIMRALLSLNPEGARQVGLDEIYPVNGLKAFRQKGRYHLQYPGDWLGDESIAFSKQAAAETPTLRQRKRIIPDAAFGPGGGGIAPVDKAQSLSVIVQSVPSESLQLLLGDPPDAFARLSKETFTSAQFGQSTELLLAQQADGKYGFEYLVRLDSKKGPVCIHCWSVVALRRSPSSGELYTMTLVVPDQMWTSGNKEMFHQVWRSFELE